MPKTSQVAGPLLYLSEKLPLLGTKENWRNVQRIKSPGTEAPQIKTREEPLQSFLKQKMGALLLT